MSGTSLKISQLPSATTPLTGSELGVVVQGGVTSQVPVSAIGGNQPSVGKTMALPLSGGQITNPTTGLTFAQLRTQRPMEFMAPELVTWWDNFTNTSPGDQWTSVTQGGTFTPTFTGYLMSLATSSGGVGYVYTPTSISDQPNQFCAYVEVLQQPADASGSNGVTLLTISGLNYIGAQYVSSGTPTLSIVSEYGGTTQTSSLALTLTAPYRLGLQLDGTTVRLWISQKNGSGQWGPWVCPLTQVPAQTGFNLLAPATFTGWNLAIQVFGAGTTPGQFGEVGTGFSGQQGLRDFRIVTLANGQPYVSNGYMYFTATCTGGHCGIYKYNPKTGRLLKTGALLWNVSGSNYGQLNGHIVYDATLGAWRVFYSNWQTGGLTSATQVYQNLFYGDILNGVHVLQASNSVQLNLSQHAGNATYDACLIYDTPNARWLCAYTISPGGSFGGNMYSCLDTSPDLVNWASVWTQPAYTNYEGTWITRMGGNLYVFAGSTANFRCWNLAGTALGTMNAPFPATTGNPPSHFIPWAWQEELYTSWYAFSFDDAQYNSSGTFSAGSMFIYRASQQETGFEFSPAIGIT